MKPKPVKRYRRPAYPTRLDVISDPDLLRRHLPAGWRAIPGMAGSIALFLAANSVVQGADKRTAAPGTAAIVAPIFDHGEGRGATGCIVVAPPVFLSEEEAWQVIDEELTRRGVTLPEKRMKLEGVEIPQRMTQYDYKSGKMEEQVMERGSSVETFTVDREDSKKRIALEFLSSREYFKAGGPSSSSTVQSYDFRKTAQRLAEDIKKQAKEGVYVGLLYDPLGGPMNRDPKTAKPKTMAEWTAYTKAIRAEANAESKRLLRLQVQDFLKWLEAQGAI